MRAWRKWLAWRRVGSEDRRKDWAERVRRQAIEQERLRRVQAEQSRLSILPFAI